MNRIFKIVNLHTDDDDLPKDKEGLLLWGLLRGEKYMRGMLLAGHQKLTEIRRTKPDAAGLILCQNQAHACWIRDLLIEVTGTTTPPEVPAPAPGPTEAERREAWGMQNEAMLNMLPGKPPEPPQKEQAKRRPGRPTREEVARRASLQQAQQAHEEQQELAESDARQEAERMIDNGAFDF